MRRIFCKYILITLGLLILYVGVTLWDISRVGNTERERVADCAIVLGAAAWHDKPSPVFEARLNHAIELFKKGRVDHLVLTGGYGKGAPFSESEVAFDYCVKKGVPRQSIRIESDSQTTLQNIQEAQKIILSEGWQNALMVSDPWHLKRARKMAHDLDLDVFTSATTSSRYESVGARTRFLFREFVMYHRYLLSGE